MSRRLKLLLISLAVIAAGLFLYGGLHKNSPGAKGSNKFTPPRDAVSVAQQYIQAREDAVGADQTTPFSWLSQVKSITTPDWFSKLQPDPSSPTSNVPNDYYTAHTKGWVVQVDVTNCVWDTKTAQPSESSGQITCLLTDRTLNKSNNTDVSIDNIPFGWGHSGQQPSPEIKLIKQNGAWLVDGVGESPSE